MTDPFDGACPVRWLIDDIGRYLAGPTPRRPTSAAGARR